MKKRLILLFLFSAVFGLSAVAALLNVGYAATSTSPFTFVRDQFHTTGNAGTLDGVTHPHTQNGILSISQAFDQLTAMLGSAPVRFDTGLRSWDVPIEGLTSGPIDQDEVVPGFNAHADFTPVRVRSAPESSSILLLCSGFSGLAAFRSRNRRA